MTEVSPRPGPKPPEMRTRRGPRGRAASIYKWWSPLEVTDAAPYGVRDCRCARADLVRPRRRGGAVAGLHLPLARLRVRGRRDRARRSERAPPPPPRRAGRRGSRASQAGAVASRSEEHTSELQSRLHLVCRLLLEKKKLPKIHHRDH